MANAESSSSAILLPGSETDDPGGVWRPVQIGVDPDQERSEKIWLDFPSIGFSSDKVTVTVNLFTIAGNRFVGASIYVFEKADFLASVGSIRVDVNDDGDILVGHAWLSANIHPSGAFTFLPKGSHTTATTIVFATGLDVYPSDRWGDYSITQVDPDNDHDFWTQQESAAKRNKKARNWQTV